MPRTSPEPDDNDVDAVLEEFGGDPRAAIRALLHDIELLARDHAASVSHGYVRGELFPFVQRRPSPATRRVPL